MGRFSKESLNLVETQSIVFQITYGLILSLSLGEKSLFFRNINIQISFHGIFLISFLFKRTVLNTYILASQEITILWLFFSCDQRNNFYLTYFSARLN